MPTRRAFLVSSIALGLTGLFGSRPAKADERIKVVASFSILADMVLRVGGDRVKVTTLVGPDSDAHVYQPTPADARSLAQTQLLIVNGLGFEGWMERLTVASGFTGLTVTATTGIVPLQLVQSGTDSKGAEPMQTASDPGAIDPHAWQNLANARIYVRNITEGLISIDPQWAEFYRSNAARYLREINADEQLIREAIASLPVEQRRVVTSHDAFGYFSAAYGIEFHAPVGVSTESEASAGDIAKLIRQIKEQQIGAVFIENVSDRRLMDQIVRETGAKIGGTLYSDALSNADGPADTYLGMMRHNVRVLIAALRS